MDSSRKDETIPAPARVPLLPSYGQLIGGVFLVTGGGGFVGRSLTAALLQNGAAAVHSLDLSTPLRSSFNHCIPPISDDQWRRIIFHDANITRYSVVDDVIKATVATSLALTQAGVSSGGIGLFHVASFGKLSCWCTNSSSPQTHLYLKQTT
jgi:NAD(P)-dependent dehydrogenase (short-subunit alcohol dehydrogenase family)